MSKVGAADETAKNGPPSVRPSDGREGGQTDGKVAADVAVAVAAVG